uniref:Protein FAR1-RELATED SEQUENCE n=1 Tax=Lactuca sativa TaxID=4236 RepID=A0A9R1X6W9_LACSA|nr:hypothetical protein LSAT_V11C500247670 [Lactuca sativa]
MEAEEQSTADHDYVSPGGSLYWTPEASYHIKLKIKSIYDSYADAVRMYINYALEAGFDVRLGTLRTSTLHVITKRHLFYNREGKPNTSKVDTMDIQHNKPKRRKDSFRVDFKANIVLKIISGTVKKKYVPNFTFEYKAMDKKPNTLFWANETAKRNYNAFGDVVSLDATFNTNSRVEIPAQYILKRRRRDVIPTKLLKRRVLDSGYDLHTNKYAIEKLSIVDNCVSSMSHDLEKFQAYLDDQHKLKKKYIDDCPSNELPTRDTYYKNLLKVTIPDVMDIENPSDIRNKGSGSRGK